VPRLPSARYQKRGYWFTTSDPLATCPGAATYHTCHIIIPFKHRVLRALLGCTDIDNVGAIKAELMQADDGDAKAGTQVGDDIADATLASTTDTQEVFEFALASEDRAEAPANRVYHLALTGDNANDRIEQPALSLLVMEIPV
jgi:hypothetical protein